MAEPNFRNRTLYHGDNLDFLRGMNSETVHLIATDPPFNKNRDFHATPDSLAAGAKFRDRWSWERDVHDEWTDSIKDDWPAVWEVIDAARAAYGDDMGAFLCWLGVRLMEMHRVLRADGSLYLHCDPTASHYLKAMLDAIFGGDNFRNEITWKRTSAKGLAYRNLPNNHDILLRYSKSGAWIWNPQFVPHDPNYVEKFYRFIEEDTGRRYRLDNLANPNKDRPNLTYEFLGVTRVWRWTRERMLEAYENGLVIQTKPGSVPALKRYLDEQKGRPIGSVWTDIQPVQSQAKERTGYPTQKPLALYERIIQASSNEGDFVLDPFCGCATTPVAAEQLNRQWVGMDIWDGARDIVLQRLAEEGMVTADSDHGLMFPHDVHVETTPPERSDDNEVAAPSFKLRIRRPREPWQRISHKSMTNVLAVAQASGDGVMCAGCGRVMEREFMQLDHITPRSDRGENHILNRILLCGPCNRRKRDYLTLRGLMRENKKKAVAWMKDEDRAKLAQDSARDRAEWLRDNFDTPECQALIAGRSGPA